MRSFELPGTPYFFQPVTVPWDTPLFTWNHSTAREKNWFSPRTLVVRLGLLPMAVALGRWEAVPEEEIHYRQVVEQDRADYAAWLAFNDYVSFGIWQFARTCTDDIEDEEERAAMMHAILTRREGDHVEA